MSLEVREWTKINDSRWHVIPDTDNTITKTRISHERLYDFSHFIPVTSSVSVGTQFDKILKLQINEPKINFVAPN